MPIFHVYTSRNHPTGTIVERIVHTTDDFDDAIITAATFGEDKTRIVEQPERRAREYRRRKAK